MYFIFNLLVASHRGWYGMTNGNLSIDMAQRKSREEWRTVLEPTLRVDHG
jgi:hypothetical protein